MCVVNRKKGAIVDYLPGPDLQCAAFVLLDDVDGEHGDACGADLFDAHGEDGAGEGFQPNVPLEEQVLALGYAPDVISEADVALNAKGCPRGGAYRELGSRSY